MFFDPPGGTMAERAAIEDVVSSATVALPLPPSVPGPTPRIFCVKCAADVTPLPPAAKFCNRCGATRIHSNWFAPMRFCSKCGAVLDDQSEGSEDKPKGLDNLME